MKRGGGLIIHVAYTTYSMVLVLHVCVPLGEVFSPPIRGTIVRKIGHTSTSEAHATPPWDLFTAVLGHMTAM